jgi:hypothetical protein
MAKFLSAGRRRFQAWAWALTRRNVVVEQWRYAVQALWVVKSLEQQDRPLIVRREIVTREAVEAG